MMTKHTTEPTGVRLQKVIASAGVASRRAAEELITSGRVQVNDTVVTTLGTRVDPERDSIRVDGERIVVEVGKAYYVLNKPRGVVSTMSDPEGRRCLGHVVREWMDEQSGDRPERLFHVGRLDTDTEGLILLVNDGEFAHRMTHPSHEVPKTYVAEVAGTVRGNAARRLKEGVELDDGPARADAFRVVERGAGRTLVELVIHEGRKHIVRRMLAEVGHPVRRLVRTAIGPVKLGNLRPGQMRPLSPRELGTLFDLVGL